MRRRFPKALTEVLTDGIAAMYATIEKSGPRRTSPTIEDMITKRPSSLGVEGAIQLASDLGAADFIESHYFLPSFLDEIHLASPDGRVVCFDFQGVLDSFHLRSMPVVNSWHFPKIHLDSLPAHFRGAYELSDAGFEKVFNGYLRNREKFPDRNAIAVRKFLEMYFLTTRFQRVPFFYERRHYTLNLDGYDLFKDRYPHLCEEDVGSIQLLRPFHGWSLCCPRSYADEKWQERMDGIAADVSPERLLEAAANNGGRPPVLREGAAQAYHELYPNGHKPLSWKQAQKAVVAKTGVTTSISTLKRAIEDKG